MNIERDHRPLMVAIAGPNGAGKSTFYRLRIQKWGLPFVNADNLARETGVGVYEAAKMADAIRRQMLKNRANFAFETVLSDPVGDKVQFFEEAEAAGYQVIFVFIGIAGPATSNKRVAMRVSQGGHDVPSGKLVERYPRTIQNLKRAIDRLSDVHIFDNEHFNHSYRLVARCSRGKVILLHEPVPSWLRPILPL